MERKIMKNRNPKRTIEAHELRESMSIVEMENMTSSLS